MNAEMFGPFVKQAVQNAIRTGASQLLEEVAESLTADDLAKLIRVLQKVETKKRGTIDAKGTPSTR
jgi:hypothetical protein